MASQPYPSYPPYPPSVVSAAPPGKLPLRPRHDFDDRFPSRSLRASIWLRNLCAWLTGNQVSALHLHEATERFHSLLAQVEYYARVDCARGVVTKENETRCEAINTCYQNLIQAAGLLTRHHGDLNNLWRAMTRVRLMLFEQVIDDAVLPHQLDFCREEARRLHVEKDPDVNELLQKLAEANDDSGSNGARMKRCLRATLERFNTLRTERIYQQHVIMKTYLTALWWLLLLAVVLIYNVETLVAPAGGSGASPALSGALFLQDPLRWIAETVMYANALLLGNVLAFVFFGGLIGGVFSVVLRVRDYKPVAGEDVYFRLYVLSKPLVGALGAVITFLLFRAGLVSDSLVGDLGTVPGIQVFGFAFVAGFSERMVFPHFGQTKA